MLEAKHICRSYGDLDILRNVDLVVNSGEVISIVGKSGTGKSTLLHILGTLDNPDQGEVIIDGINTRKLPAKKLAKFRNQKIGFVFQFHHLLAEFSALENVCIPAYINGLSKNEAEFKALKLLDYLGLSKRTEHKPAQLSGGEQQRVAVARSLINDPKIVFADEPTGNLDNQTSDELHQLIIRLQDEMGQTFVIVTHNKDLASMSQKQYEMSDGQLRQIR